MQGQKETKTYGKTEGRTHLQINKTWRLICKAKINHTDTETQREDPCVIKIKPWTFLQTENKIKTQAQHTQRDLNANKTKLRA